MAPSLFIVVREQAGSFGKDRVMLGKWGAENEFSEELVVVQLRCLCWGQTEVKSREVREGLKARQSSWLWPWKLADREHFCASASCDCSCVKGPPSITLLA